MRDEDVSALPGATMAGAEVKSAWKLPFGPGCSEAWTALPWSGITAVSQYLSVKPAQPPVVEKFCGPFSASLVYFHS